MEKEEEINWEPDWERLHDEEDVYTGPTTWTGKLRELFYHKLNIINEYIRMSMNIQNKPK